jgi:tRNA uridine 5-carbamoylmethylation protein Kti12
MCKVLIVSGPPCSGKTFFIESISEPLIGKLGLYLGSNYKVYNANYIRSNNLKKSENVLIHYDSFRSYKRDLNVSIETDVFLSKIFNGQNLNIGVIFLSCPLNVLINRIEKRVSRLQNKISDLRLYKLNKLIKIYNNSESYVREYRKWVNFIKNTSTQNMYILRNGYSKCENGLFDFDENLLFATDE